MELVDSIERIDEAFIKAFNSYCKSYNTSQSEVSEMDCDSQARKEAFELAKTDLVMHLMGRIYVSNVGVFDPDSLMDMPLIVEDSENEIRKNASFGRLPVQDSLKQIVKYALIKSYDSKNISGVDYFGIFRDLMLVSAKEPEEAFTVEIDSKKYIGRFPKFKPDLFRSMSNLLNNENALRRLINTFVECRYRGLVDIDMVDSYKPDSITSNEDINKFLPVLLPTGELDEPIPVLKRVSNFIQGKKIELGQKLQQVTMREGKDLRAIIRRSNEEKNGALLKRHPRNKNFKIMAIAKSTNGVSNYVINMINTWFSRLDPSLYEDEENLKTVFRNKLRIINYKLVQHNSSPVDLSVALVGRKKTMVFSFGDYNIYSIEGHRFTSGTVLKTIALGTSGSENVINASPVEYSNDYDRLWLLCPEADYQLSNHSVKPLVEQKKSKKLLRRLKGSETEKSFVAAFYDRSKEE